jgi:hypothetical protein
MQFRRGGYVDVRVSRPLVRRALKILDTLFKRLEKEGIQVQIAPRESSYHQGARRYTFATDRREQVQITVTEKTTQRPNPAWSEEKRYSVDKHFYDSTGRLTLVLDDEMYAWSFKRPRKWSDAKGHLVEEHVEEAVSSIRQVLEDKRQARRAAEEEREREIERQKIRADEQRQDKEEERRVDQLKVWAQTWRECERLRAFVAAWEQRMEVDGSRIAPGSPADAWRRWAHLAIDQLDPLIDTCCIADTRRWTT